MNFKLVQIILTGVAISVLSSCTKDDLPSFDPEEIPVINIVREDPISWENKVPCTIKFTSTYKYDVLPAHIKYRGGSSSKFEKHSFSFELENKYTFFDLPRDDDWILNANYIDKTFMRHKISYDIFRQMNKKNVASQSIYVNVELNDEPRGLYLLMEEVNGAMAGLNKSDSLAMMFKDPPLFYREKIPHPQEPDNYYQQKFPKIYDSDKTGYIEHFKDFLFNSSDIDFLNGIENWIDIDNVTDWHILLLFSNNSDGIMKNFYLYKIDSSTPFRIAIWDYDHSFGRDGDNEMNMMERELDCNRSVLLRRLMGIPQSVYPKKLKDRWFSLRNAHIVSVVNMKKHIEANNKIIKEAVERNFEIWPVNSKWYYDSNSYDDEIQILMDFTELRIPQLDLYFNNL
jgi:hypothetical protein